MRQHEDFQRMIQPSIALSERFANGASKEPKAKQNLGHTRDKQEHNSPPLELV